MTESKMEMFLKKRRERARKLVSRGSLKRQVGGMIRRNPAGFLKWVELTLLGKHATSVCYNDPFILQIENTNVCNLKCRMCPREKEFEKEGITPSHMSFETFRDIVQDWIHNIYQIHLFGRGEPTLAPDLAQMIRYAAEQGVPYITFNTNGHPLRGKMAEQIAASEVDEIRVSVDGTDEDTYRKIRGVSLERLRENIREFKKLSDVPIAISATLSRDNWDNLKALPGLAEEIGAFCIRLYPVAPYTYLGVEDLGLSNEQKKQYKEYCADLKARCQTKGIHFTAISHKALTCNVPFIMAFVDIDSNLTVCCRLETNVVGNILKDGFRNAWRSPAMTAWRKRMLSGKFPKLCTDLECIHDWR